MTTAIATLMAVYAGDDPEALAEAIESTLAQELPPEIDARLYIGVDGPLPDPLEQVLARYASRCTLVLRSPVNRGLARTLNGLIERLSDEAFLFRMDADDISLPGRYRAQLDHLAAHPDVDIVGTAITEFDPASGAERVVRFARSPADAAARIHQRVPVAHPSVCFRRRVFKVLTGYPLAGTNEDIALWFECLRKGMVFDNVEASLLRFRLSKHFWQRRGWAKARSEFTSYVGGIHALHGPWTWRYAAPVARLALRLSPAFVSRWAYRRAFRR